MKQCPAIASGSLLFLLAIAVLAPSPIAAATVQLSFDHGSRQWSVQGPAELRVESGVPTLYMRKGDALDVQVTHSNTLLYGAAFGELTSEPEDNVEALRKLFALLGAVARAELATPASPLDEAERERHDELRKALVSLKAAAGGLGDALFAIDRGRWRAISYIQAVEEPGFAPRPWAPLSLRSVELQGDDCPGAPVDGLEKLGWLFQCVAIRLQRYESLAADENDDLLGDIEELLGAEEETTKTLVRLLAFDREVCLADAGKNAERQRRETGTCTPPAASLQTIRVGEWPSHASWESKQTQKVEITEDSPFREQVVPRLGALSPQFRVRWRFGELFGIGVAVTQTDLTSPEYAAVAPSEGGDRIVTKTGESSRSGELALMLNYRLLQHLRPNSRDFFLRPGLELGAGVDDDKPAVFAGLSLEIARYVRVGWGWTWQEVDELDGQIEGMTVVADDDAIKTRRDFHDGMYLSFSFAIDSLNLFSLPED